MFELFGIQNLSQLERGGGEQPDESREPSVGLLSLDVETRVSPPLVPPPRVCGEVYLTLPYLLLVNIKVSWSSRLLNEDDALDKDRVR